MNDEAVYRTAPATPGLLKSYTYITAIKKHVLEAHIVALEVARQTPGGSASHNISPSVSPPAKKEKPSNIDNDLVVLNKEDSHKLMGCEMCGKFARGKI